jgi:hypothetical protein
MYVIIFLLGFLMNVFFKYIEMKKFLKIYLINIIFLVIIILILNSIIKLSYTNTELTLQNQFYIKVNSAYKFLINDNNYGSSLESSSALSWAQKLAEYSEIKEYSFEYNSGEKNNYKYYENSFLFLLVNLPLVFFLNLLYFAKESCFILKKKNYQSTNNFFYAIFILSFIYLNIIYNFTEDSVNYLYLLLMLIFKKTNFTQSFYK